MPKPIVLNITNVTLKNLFEIVNQATPQKQVVSELISIGAASNAGQWSDLCQKYGFGLSATCKVARAKLTYWLAPGCTCQPKPSGHPMRPAIEGADTCQAHKGAQ